MVMEMLLRYKPCDADELFDILVRVKFSHIVASFLVIVDSQNSRGFINIFSSMATGFHRQAKCVN